MVLVLLTLLALSAATQVFDFHSDYMSKFVKSDLAELRDAQIECPIYTCGTLPANQCVQYLEASNDYVLQPCNATSFCSVAIDSQSNSTCLPAPAPSTTLGNPGDPCSTVADCSGIGATCVSHVCQGLGENQICTDQPDCDVGLMCENLGTNGTCQYQINTGKACNTWVYDINCVNGDVCNNQACVPMFSQPIGAIVSSDYGYFSCSTGFYEPFPNFIERGMCAPAPKSPVSQLPISCVPGTLCYSSDGAYTSPCQCGINGNGAAFCPVFPGDEIYQNYLKLMKLYVKESNATACHELDYGQEDCGAPDGTFVALNKAKVAVDLQVLIQGNSPCIKSIYTPDYWSAQLENEEKLSLY